jgi:trimeric autotransporter adhesin
MPTQAPYESSAYRPRWVAGRLPASLLLASLLLATACSDDGPSGPPPPRGVSTHAAEHSAIEVQRARGSLTNGATHTATISAAGQTDSWTFSATLGNTLVVAIGEVTGSAAFTPWIRLIAPNGATIGNTWGAAAAQIQVAAPATGTYTVIVGSADVPRAGTGSYRLTLVKAPGALVVSPGDQGGTLANGTSHPGSILVGDVDAWTFSASQGNALVVSVGEITGSAGFTPWIRLVAPNGAVIGNTWGAAAAQIQVNAPATGTYTVVVGTADVGRAGTGSYFLRLVRAPGTFVVAPGEEGGPMTAGATHGGNISIGDLDPWTFNATQGNTIVVAIGEVTGSAAFTPWIRLVAPNGAVIGNTWGAAAAQIHVAAPATGSYTVIVGTADVGRAGTGTYRLTLVKAPGTLTVSSGDQGGQMTNGAIHAGSIFVGDVDAWTFTASQGNAIIVGLGEVTGSAAFTPWLRLVAPNGAVIGNTWGAAAAQVQVNAPATGTYTVVVGTADVGRAGTGNYRLTLARAPGTFTLSSGDQGGSLTRGVDRPGGIVVGDVDPWTFTATQGSALTVIVHEVTGSAAFTPWIRLIAPNGAVIGNRWGAASAQITATAPSTGTYTVVVGTADVGRAGTGDYRLRRP